MKTTFNLLPPFEDDGRYLIVFLDNSDSMRKVGVDGRSLFSHEVELVNCYFDELRKGKKSDKTFVLRVTFDGVLEPGWQRLWRVNQGDTEFEYLDENSIPTCNCSPVLDIFGGVLDLVEEVASEAEKNTLNIKCGILVVTDGLDGFQVGEIQVPVSATTPEQIRERLVHFLDSGFSAHLLAIGQDNGTQVASFFQGLGFPEAAIVRTDVDPKRVRHGFGDLSSAASAALNG